jgi:hypothetical protein
MAYSGEDAAAYGTLLFVTPPHPTQVRPWSSIHQPTTKIRSRRTPSFYKIPVVDLRFNDSWLIGVVDL